MGPRGVTLLTAGVWGTYPRRPRPSSGTPQVRRGDRRTVGRSTGTQTTPSPLSLPDLPSGSRVLTWGLVRPHGDTSPPYPFAPQRSLNPKLRDHCCYPVLRWDDSRTGLRPEPRDGTTTISSGTRGSFTSVCDGQRHWKYGLRVLTLESSLSRDHRVGWDVQRGGRWGRRTGTFGSRRGLCLSSGPRPVPHGRPHVHVSVDLHRRGTVLPGTKSQVPPPTKDHEECMFDFLPCPSTSSVFGGVKVFGTRLV